MGMMYVVSGNTFLQMFNRQVNVHEFIIIISQMLILWSVTVTWKGTTVNRVGMLSTEIDMWNGEFTAWF